MEIRTGGWEHGDWGMGDGGWGCVIRAKYAAEAILQSPALMYYLPLQLQFNLVHKGLHMYLYV